MNQAADEFSSRQTENIRLSVAIKKKSETVDTNKTMGGGQVGGSRALGGRSPDSERRKGGAIGNSIFLLG